MTRLLAYIALSVAIDTALVIGGVQAAYGNHALGFALCAVGGALVGAVCTELYRSTVTR